jgi:hypothetical protein
LGQAVLKTAWQSIKNHGQQAEKEGASPPVCCRHPRKQSAVMCLFNGINNQNGADQICAISLSEVG